MPEQQGLVERVVGRVLARVEPLVGRVLGVPRIGMAHAVYQRFSASSGPVLARGLAFVALFALVPALIVVASIAGFLVRDNATRDEIVAILAQQFPPLEALIEEALKGAGDIAATTGLIGIVLLIWSASGLVRALDGAFRVVFEDDGEGRTPLRDVIAVASVAAGTFGAAVILAVLTLPGPLDEIIGVPSPQGRSAVSLVVLSAIVALSYRFVPRPRPGWRMLALPAVAVGTAIWALTALFTVLGPLLFGSAQLYGAFGALFLGLIWLSNVTQLILLGAAWVAERDRRARTVPTLPGEAPGL